MEMDGEELEEEGARRHVYGGGQDDDKAEGGRKYDYEVHDGNGRAVLMDPDGDYVSGCRGNKEEEEEGQSNKEEEEEGHDCSLRTPLGCCSVTVVADAELFDWQCYGTYGHKRKRSKSISVIILCAMP